MSAPVAIEVTDLVKHYVPLPRWMSALARNAVQREVVALDGISLRVERGSICAVVGPNGAGKSTLFRILMGLTTPTSGAARIMGLDCSVRAQSRQIPIGFMPADDRSLLLRLSCRENLVFQGQLRGMRGRYLDQRVDSVLGLVGLGDRAESAAFALSSGMRARLQLGRALVHEPTVLVLDEPTSAVDPVAAYDLLELIRELTGAQELAVMISSHRLEEIDVLDEAVLLLDEGRVVFDGSLRVLRALTDVIEVAIEFDDATVATSASARLGVTPGVDKVTEVGRTVEVRGHGTVGSLLAALGDADRHVVHVNEHSGSTRSILKRLYEASPRTDRPVGDEGRRDPGMGDEVAQK